MSNDPRIARTRARVLDAAWALLQRHGPGGVTHLRVAKESGVGRATVYRHWPSPELLIGEAMTRNEFSLSLGVEGTTRERLLHHMVVVCRHLSSPASRALLTVLVPAEVSPELEKRTQEALEIPLRTIRSVVVAGKESGELDPDLDVDVGLGMLFGPLFFHRMVLNKPFPEDELEKLLESVLGPGVE